MVNSGHLIPAQVTCYSGHTCAECPRSFTWESTELGVKEVKRQWREPGEKRFRVCTDDDRTFELCYDEGGGRWFATEWVSSSEKGGRDEQGSP